MFSGLAVKCTLGLSTLAMLQAAVNAPSQDLWWSQAEHLTLEGALIVAVAILWRALQVKDTALVASVKTVTEALTAAATSNAELRAIIKESVQAKEKLAESIDMLRISLHLSEPK